MDSTNTQPLSTESQRPGNQHTSFTGLTIQATSDPRDIPFINYRNSSEPLIKDENDLKKFRVVKSKLDYLAKHHYDYFLSQLSDSKSSLKPDKLSRKYTIAEYVKRARMDFEPSAAVIK